VRDGCEEFGDQPIAPEGQLLRMTTRAESCLARESNQELRLALGAYDPGEPAFEDAAVEVFVDNPAGDVGSQGAVLILEAFFIAEQKLLEVVFEEPVEGGASGSARSISWLGSRLVRLDRAGGGSHRMIRIGIEMIGGLRGILRDCLCV